MAEKKLKGTRKWRIEEKLSKITMWTEPAAELELQRRQLCTKFPHSRPQAFIFWQIIPNLLSPLCTLIMIQSTLLELFFSEKSLLSAVTFILWGVNAWIKLQSTINLGLKLSELLEILKISERPTWRGRWAPMHHGTLGFGWRAMENVSLSLSTYTHVPPNKIYVRLFISLV